MAFGGGTGTVEVGDGRNDGSMIDPERQQLEEELMEAQCTLAGEVQQIENLARRNTKKIKELHDLNGDVIILQERNECHTSMLQDEHSSAKHELAHRLSVLHEQLAQLKFRHERYHEAAHESEEALGKVKVGLTKREQRTKMHAEEVHATRQKILKLAQGLESTFRITLKDLEGTYRGKAFKMLKLSQKAGMRVNKMLRDEMALQKLGVATLQATNLEQVRKAGELEVEVGGLKKFEEKHMKDLVDLQRRTKLNDRRIACIEEVKRRMIIADQSLRNQLQREGIPDRSLDEILQMTSKEEDEGRRLDKLRRVWQRRVKDLTEAIERQLPYSSTTPEAKIASTILFDCSPGSRLELARGPTIVLSPRRSNTSDESGGVKRGIDGNDALTAKKWRARVRRVTDGWGDIDDLGCKWRGKNVVRSECSVLGTESSIGGGQHYRSEGGANLEWRRSASLPAFLRDEGSSQSQRRSTNLQGRGRGPFFQHAPTLGDVRFIGHLGLQVICEGSPWERKRRMQRKIKVREARMRAKGIPVNSEFAR